MNALANKVHKQGTLRGTPVNTKFTATYVGMVVAMLSKFTAMQGWLLNNVAMLSKLILLLIMQGWLLNNVTML